MQNFDDFVEHNARLHRGNVHSLLNGWLTQLSYAPHWQKLQDGKEVSIELPEMQFDNYVVRDAIAELNAAETGWLARLSPDSAALLNDNGRTMIRKGWVGFIGRKHRHLHPEYRSVQ